jgi:hypothetical protein
MYIPMSLSTLLWLNLHTVYPTHHAACFRLRQWSTTVASAWLPRVGTEICQHRPNALSSKWGFARLSHLGGQNETQRQEAVRQAQV